MNGHLEKRDGVIYFVTEDGSAWEYSRVLHNRQFIADTREKVADARAKRRWWYEHVESRDWEGSRAARADFADGRWERKLIAWLDGQFAKTSLELPCIVAKRNCKRVARRLMLVDWRKVGKFVAAVWQNGEAGREKTMADFEITDRTYRWRCQLYASLLGWGNGGEKRFWDNC